MFTTRKLALVSGAAALGLALTGCGGSDDSNASGDTTPAASGTTAAAASADVCPDGKLTLAVEPYEDAKNLIPAYQELAQGLGDKLGCTVDLQISDSYVAEILAMQNGKVDLGEFGPLGFVFASKQAGATALASFADETGKVSSYTGGIWVPKGSPITSIDDLKGHTLALSESGSTSGDAVPRAALVKAGIDKDVDAQYAGGHVEALQALVNGKVDAAEINSQTLASAQAEKTFDPSGYTQIWTSEPILNDPIAAGPNMSPEAAKAVQAALLTLPGTTVAKIGEFLDFKAGQQAMVSVGDDDYKPLFDLADSLHLTTDDL
jgi:phosphonate transport system substrate-binding protein